MYQKIKAPLLKDIFRPSAGENSSHILLNAPTSQRPSFPMDDMARRNNSGNNVDET